MRLEVEFLTLISCDFFVSVWAFDRDSPRIYIEPYVHKIRAAGKTVIYYKNLSKVYFSQEGPKIKGVLPF